MVGCAKPPQLPARPEVEKVEKSVNYANGGRVYNERGYPMFSIYTVEHDGCKFVITRGWNGEGVSTVHHPQCPCQKVAKQ